MRSRVLAAGILFMARRAALAHSAARAGRFTYTQHPLRRTVHVRPPQIHARPGGNWYGGWPAWVHGYPLSERNLMRIMQEVSDLDPHVDDINAITLDDPELFRFPIAYIIELDWWSMTDREAAALRAYLQKGGFIIVDDFKPLRGGSRRFGVGWASGAPTAPAGVFERT